MNHGYLPVINIGMVLQLRKLTYNFFCFFFLLFFMNKERKKEKADNCNKGLFLIRPATSESSSAKESCIALPIHTRNSKFSTLRERKCSRIGGVPG